MLYSYNIMILLLIICYNLIISLLLYVLTMPSITAKKIKGHTYYYARQSKRINGKPKIVWQKIPRPRRRCPRCFRSPAQTPRDLRARVRCHCGIVRHRLPTQSCSPYRPARPQARRIGFSRHLPAHRHPQPLCGTVFQKFHRRLVRLNHLAAAFGRRCQSTDLSALLG